MTNPVPQFPRGFVYSSSPVVAPDDYVRGPLLENLFVHPWASVQSAGGEDLFVIILGTCVPTLDDYRNAAEVLLAELMASEEQFLRALSHYSGRHAILFGSVTDVKAVNDATAMRSVFYAADGGVIASHALLVERALGGDIERNEMPFRSGYPGNRTPYERTRILTANTYLVVTTTKVHRFWPRRALAAVSVEDAATYCLSAAVAAFKNISKDRTVKLALTAGLDSRVMLAVAMKAGADVETYTYGRASDTARDRAFAPDLAAAHGYRHSLIPTVVNSGELRESLAEAHYITLHRPVVRSLMERFGDPSAVSVSANLLEIGRAYFENYRLAGIPEPVDAERVLRTHRRSMGKRTQEEIVEYGEGRFAAIAGDATRGFVDDTDLESAVQFLDPFDLFYWEHRMSTWHGAGMVERDFYAEPFIPFNSRAIFETLLGVPHEDRKAAAVFYRMIEMVEPSLLDLPINPKTWPLEVV